MNRAFPKNLARAHMGAEILESAGAVAVATPDGGVAGLAGPRVLLTDDSSLAMAVEPGTVEFIVDLSEHSVVREVKFKPFGAAGRVTVSPSVDRKSLATDDWGWSRSRAFSGEESVVSVGMGAVDARFFRVRFDVERPGAIGGFGMFGLKDARAYDIAPAIGEQAGDDGKGLDPVDLNVASIHAGARVIFTSAGDGDPNDLIDGDPGTTFVFSPDAAAPIAVIELGAPFDLSRVSVLGDAVPAVVGVTGFRSLPGTGFSPEMIASDGAIPLGTISAGPEGRSNASVDGSGIRYLALSWRPAGGASLSPFGVAEVGAFSTMPFADAVRIIEMNDVAAKGRIAASREPSEFRYGPLGTMGMNGLRRTALRGALDTVDALRRGEDPEEARDQDASESSGSGRTANSGGSGSQSTGADSGTRSARSVAGEAQDPPVLQGVSGTPVGGE